MAKKPSHLTTVTEAFAHLKECGQITTINALLKHEAAAATIQAHATSLLKLAELIYDRSMGEMYNTPRHCGTEMVVRNLTKTHVIMGMSTVMRRKEPQGERMFFWVDYYHDKQDVIPKLAMLDRLHGKTVHPDRDPVEMLRQFLEAHVTSSYTELMVANVFGAFQSYLDSGYKCVVAMELNGNAVFTFHNPNAHYELVDLVYNHSSLLADLAASMGLVAA